MRISPLGARFDGFYSSITDFNGALLAIQCTDDCAHAASVHFTDRFIPTIRRTPFSSCTSASSPAEDHKDIEGGVGRIHLQTPQQHRQNLASDQGKEVHLRLDDVPVIRRLTSHE